MRTYTHAMHAYIHTHRYKNMHTNTHASIHMNNASIHAYTQLYKLAYIHIQTQTYIT